MMSCVIYYCCEWQTRRPLNVTSCTTSRDAPMCERGKSHQSMMSAVVLPRKSRIHVLLDSELETRLSLTRAFQVATPHQQRASANSTAQAAAVNLPGSR